MNRNLSKLTATSLALTAGWATALQAQTEDVAEDSPTFELGAYEVSASADASAEGLSLPYSGGQVARGGRIGLLGTQDYLNTPFNLTSYTQQLIENQQAASVGDVLLNDPAVRVARGFGNFQQLYMVRGLPVYSDDMAYNGLYGLLPRQYLATELIERVEVLRGANAFLNGAAPGGSGLGGAVNVMPKRAPNDRLTELTAGVQSGGQSYGAFDYGQRFLDEQVGVRFNAVQRDGDTAVDGASSYLGLVATGVDFYGENLRVSADLGYQDHQTDASMPSITIAAGLDIPDAPDADTTVAQPWTYSNERDTFGTLRTEYDLSDYVTAWIAGGFRESEESASFANPTVNDAAGNMSAYRFDNVREDEVKTGEVGLRSAFTTGPVGHRISASAAAFQSKSKNAYAMSDFFTPENMVQSNLYEPEDVAAPAADYFVGGDMGDPLETERVETSSFALADQLSFLEERLIVTAGARYQKIENNSFDYNTGDKLSSYSESAVTPVGGILFKLTPRLSVYANYIQGLTKGDVAPETSNNAPVENAGEVMDPYKTEQYELGLKFDTERVGGAISVFQSEKPNYEVVDQVFREANNQDNLGLEISAYGEAVEGFKVLGGVSFIQTEVDDHDAIGAPTTQANVGFDWLVPVVDGLSLDARALYTSSQYADAANTQRVPSWTRFDLGARYTLPIADQLVTLRLRVENVADEDYWASAGGYPGTGYLTVGAPRTFIASAAWSF